MNSALTPADEAYRKKMQKRILVLIKNQLESRAMDAKRAQELSRYVLSCFDKGDPKPKVYQAIKNFDLNKFPELLDISLLAIKEQVEEQSQEFADKVGVFIKDHKLEEANQLLAQFRSLVKEDKAEALYENEE